MLPRPAIAARIRRTAGRTGAALVIAAGFLVLAYRIDPLESQASQGASVDGPIDLGALSRRRMTTQGQSLGELVGKDFVIRAVAADPEPLYTILGADGAVLGERLRAEEVYRLLPDVDINALMADVQRDERPFE